LRRLQGGVAAIRRGEGERIMGSFPRDILPLASELNLLIASNREIVERARTHVGNLAHALKTPLSVILNEAETAPPDSEALAEKVREQAGIMREQVNYHLERARAAARSSVIGTVTDVQPVVDGLIRTFDKIYRDRAVIFTAEVPHGLRFRGERQDFEEMAGNLIDNAGKWAAERVAVTVAPARQGDLVAGVAVVVEDDGPGLTPDERAVVTRRGRRMDETKPGSGLGLSIVVDLAGVYGGMLTLDESRLGGLRATLLLP
jgi:signal transduction histidine kinase